MKLVAGLILLLLTSSAIAQSPQAPVVFSPAFDPNCYQPQLGTAGEFDTVHSNGSPNNVHNLGPGPGESYGRIVMTGLPNDPPFLAAIETGPTFELANLHVINDLHFNPGPIVRTAHLHTSTSVDLIVNVNSGSLYRIYWQTADGWYDENLYTSLRFRGDWSSNAFTARLISDTVDDIAAEATNLTVDSLFAIYYRGGTSLYSQGKMAYPDSELSIPVQVGQIDPFARVFVQGNWRGTGRSDAIGYEEQRGTWFFYRNDPPFSLRKFAEAMLKDTLFTLRENPGYLPWYEFTHALSFAALPKAPWDRSEDFVVPLDNSDRSLSGSIRIFRGGPEFGLERLFQDSAAVTITNPSHLDGTLSDFRFFGSSITNCGDMTGTGRPVLFTGMGSGFSGVNFFYVLGDAADDKIDIYFPNDYGISYDSMTADGDNKEDLLIANPTLAQLALLHGSTKIPHRVNPKLALTGVNHSSIPSIIPFPNPAARALRFSLTIDAGESVSVSLRDMLGREVQSWQLAIASGEQIVDLPLDSEPSGEYFATISGPRLSGTARVTIIR